MDSKVDDGAIEAPVAAHQESANSVKLVTIHGTGAGDKTATGDRWWQFGSTFLRELFERIEIDPARVEVVPFQWDEGPNSEAKRRKAGKRLFDQLRSYDRAGHEYYVIGHSHGGSVLYSALLRSIGKRQPLERLKCWCTVGTPFLDYRANRFMFQRLKSLSLSVYTSGLFSLIIGLIVSFGLYEDAAGVGEHADEYEDMGHALLAYGVISLGGLFLLERFFRSWYTKKQKKAAHQQYRGSWLGLWHIEDEAISALANIKHVTGPIVPKNFLKPLVGIFQFMIVSLLFLLMVADVVFNQGTELKDFARELNSSSEDDPKWVKFLVNFSVNAILIVIFLIGVWVLTLLLHVVAWAVGYPLSKIINGLVWTSVRERAWGDDLLKEDVRAIASHPPEFAEQFGPLPDIVSEPLRGHSEKHAILTLHKVRMILGMSQDAKPSADIKTELSESLKWQELIHTSYFDVDEFIDLIALGLNHAGLGKLKPGFALGAEERQKLVTWRDDAQKA